MRFLRTLIVIIIILFFMFSASTANNNKNCKSKCFTLQLGNTECKIICDPPVIEQPTQAPAFGLYPQQGAYGQQYPYTGQMPSPCVPPACQPGQMYAGYMPAQPYPGQGLPAQGVYPSVSARPSPVQEGCVGRSCDQQQDEKKDDKPAKDKPASAPPKPAQAPSPYTFQVQCGFVIIIFDFPLAVWQSSVPSLGKRRNSCFISISDRCGNTQDCFISRCRTMCNFTFILFRDLIAIQVSRKKRLKTYAGQFFFLTDPKRYCCNGPNQNHITT